MAQSRQAKSQGLGVSMQPMREEEADRRATRTQEQITPTSSSAPTARAPAAITHALPTPAALASEEAVAAVGSEAAGD